MQQTIALPSGAGRSLLARLRRRFWWLAHSLQITLLLLLLCALLALGEKPIRVRRHLENPTPYTYLYRLEEEVLVFSRCLRPRAATTSTAIQRDALFAVRRCPERAPGQRPSTSPGSGPMWRATAAASVGTLHSLVRYLRYALCSLFHVDPSLIARCSIYCRHSWRSARRQRFCYGGMSRIL